MKKFFFATVVTTLVFSASAPAAAAAEHALAVPNPATEVSPQGIVWGETVRVFNSEQECLFEAEKKNYWDDGLWYYCEKQPSGAWDLKRRQGFFGAD